MAQSRKMKHSTRRKIRRTGRKGRKQHGGAYGYSAPAFSTPGGVEIENRAGYDHCYGDMRAAPVVTAAGAMRGGARQQVGGACGGCGLQQVGGGSATGGYGFQLDNSLGKVYAGLPIGPCLQTGGAAADEYGRVSYAAGYGYDKSHAVVTPSAMYLDQVPYDRTCQGGGARRRYRKSGCKSRKSGRKSRKH
jgi:hypothetical protein